MTAPKKQHYVPQFLLKNFSAGKKGKEQVWVLDKLTEKIYRTSITNAGHENYFYEYHGDDGDIELEDLMQKMDSIGAEIIQSSIEKAQFPSDPKDRVWLAYFVALQMLRTPVTRKEMENFRNLLIHKWGADIRVDSADKRTVGEYGGEDDKFSSLTVIDGVPEFAKLLQEKVWVLTQAPEGMPYIISDNPVSRHNMIERPGRGNLGLTSYGIELHMPISNHLSLHVICPELASRIPSCSELASHFERAVKEGLPIFHAPENAEFVNSLQVQQSERFIYAKKRGHLDIALDMINTNPELKSGPGIRQRPGDV